MGIVAVAPMWIVFPAMAPYHLWLCCISGEAFQRYFHQRTVGAHCVTIGLHDRFLHIHLAEDGEWQSQVKGLLATPVVDEEVILLAAE